MDENDDSGARAGVARVGRLKKRADFQFASRGHRIGVLPFTLLAKRRAAESGAQTPRVGFTVTKKIGNSPVRNRIRRRLREAVRLAQGLAAAPGHDYVLMAKRESLGRDFAALVDDVGRAFAKARPSGAEPSADAKGGHRRDTQ